MQTFRTEGKIISFLFFLAVLAERAFLYLFSHRTIVWEYRPLLEDTSSTLFIGASQTEIY